VKRSVVATLLSLNAFASGAFAAEVSIKGSANETLTASDNLFFVHPSPGWAGQTLSSVNLDFLAATPTTRYDLNTDFSYYRYFGTGAQDANPKYFTPADAKFSIDHTTPLTKYNVFASWQHSDLATTVLQQTGTFAGSGTVDTYNAGGSIKRQLGARDFITWSAQVSTASFTDPTQIPYDDWTSKIAWNHTVAPATTLITSLNFDWLMMDNAADSQRLFWNPMFGVQSQLTKRLFVYADLGYGFVNGYQHGAQSTSTTGVPIFGGSVSTLPGFQPIVGSTSNWLADLNLNYQLSKDTTAALTATRAITPTIQGQLLGIETIGASLSHRINSVSNVQAFVQFSHTKQAVSQGGVDSSVTDSFTAAATYGYDLSREWHTNVTYSYTQSGQIQANTFILSLRRDFNVYGKPPVGEQKTQSELAQQNLTRAQQVVPTVALIPAYAR
jgi:hypothetical protein